MPRYADYDAARLQGRLWTPAVEGYGVTRLWAQADRLITPNFGTAGDLLWQSWVNPRTAGNYNEWYADGASPLAPSLNLTGFDGASVPSVDFTAAGSRYMTMSQPATIGQPFVVVIAARVTTNQNDAHIVDGAAVSRALVGQSSGAWIMYGGSSVLSGPAYDTNSHVFAALFDGSSSRLYLDGSVVASGNAGGDSWAQQLLGAGNGIAATMKGHIFGLAVLATRDALTIDRAVGYFAWQARMQATLAAGHPYRNVPPLLGA